METSCIPALSCSGADPPRGPRAVADNTFPVIAVVTDGRGGQALQPVLNRLRGRGADLFVVGPKAQVEVASAGFVPPAAGVAEEVRPILEILPPRMPAYEVVIARGQDPDASRTGRGHRDPLITGRVRATAGEHPRAAAPGRDPQPVRHRSPELLGRRCAVPPAGERCLRSQGRERGYLDPPSCAGRAEALS
ncbi:hypothetical protein GA0115254_125148 [Streptomyces sp. Ncost-T10-10d]|nr:hypothetical protein GA0115254_125148 [Streptomyces sp. Ncost-T10-10d]